jgi:hypothetical protein
MFLINRPMYIMIQDHHPIQALSGLKATGYTVATIMCITVAIGKEPVKTVPGKKVTGNTTTAAIAGTEATGNYQFAVAGLQLAACNPKKKLIT